MKYFRVRNMSANAEESRGHSAPARGGFGVGQPAKRDTINYSGIPDI